MTAYTKTSDFAIKDSLLSGNPSKVVRGTEIDTEFNAIQAADADNVKTSGLATGVATFLGTPTSANLAAVLTDETGSGAAVFATSPTLVTPALGTPSALVGTNITGTAAGLTAGNVTTNANLTGHITSVGNAAVLGSFTSAQLATALTDETGSGPAVFANSPTLVTPALGTPSSATLTNATGLPAAGVVGTALVTADIGTTVQAYDADLTTWAGVTPGTGVATALAVNVGTAGAPVVNGGALGTPSSGTVTNLTGTASININGTVGATTPAAGTFTTLTSTGNMTVGDASTDTLIVQAGSAALPSIIPTGDANTGVWFPAADTVAVSTDGTERMRIDSAGNVGLGALPIAVTRAYVYLTGASTSAGEAAGLFEINTTNPSGAAPKFALQGVNYLSSGYGGTAVAVGVFGQVVLNAAVTNPVASAVRGVFSSTAAGTLTTVSGFESNISNSGAASITNVYSFIANAHTVGTNNYGFHSNIAAAANRYNFYAAGTAPNYFQGSIVGGSTVSCTSVSYALSGTAIPAGGAQAFGLSSSNTMGVYFGSGAPTVSAAKGSLYLRSDGSTTNDRMYVNTNGTTTWTAVITAA